MGLINWHDTEAAKAWKYREARRERWERCIRVGASALARKVMMNEFDRSRREFARRHKKPVTKIGNAAWQALGA
jgi:hypothetical protein